MKKQFITLMLLPFFASATSYDAVEKQLQNELEKAQSYYTVQVKKIEKQRVPKLNRVRAIERKLLLLRGELAADVRAKDEQYLSLKQLQTRLKQWQDQNRFIHNQLSSVVNDTGRISEAFNDRLTQLTTRIQPQWQRSDAVRRSGEVVNGKLLSVGPLNWFEYDGQLYLSEYIKQRQTLKVQIAQSQQAASNPLSWQILEADITAGKATKIAAENVSYWQKLQVGGIWVYPILAFGGLSLLIILIKFVQLIRMPRIKADLATQCLAQPTQCLAQPTQSRLCVSQSWQQQLVSVAWQSRHNSVEETSDRLLCQLMQFKSTLERGMSLLAATAAVAPLLGLLGTVSGMIHTFEMMNLFGNKDQSLLSGGISEALFTTELGLIVAIPALLIHAYLSRKHQSYLTQLESDTVLLTHLGKHQQVSEA